MCNVSSYIESNGQSGVAGYPLALIVNGGYICPHCAADYIGHNDASVDVHYEGASLYCDDCGAELESAYGDPDAA